MEGGYKDCSSSLGICAKISRIPGHVIDHYYWVGQKFGFFHNTLEKNLIELFGQLNTIT